MLGIPDFDRAVQCREWRQSRRTKIKVYVKKEKSEKKRKARVSRILKGAKVWGRKLEYNENRRDDYFRTTKDMSRQGNLGCLGGYLPQSGSSHIISGTDASGVCLHIPRHLLAPGPHALIFTWTEIVGNLS
ncbi:hypothetical protein VN97_g8206 [Penicillium thymicola]|uniref:Uncharacterized protein n=1 Tax=Penicillium thymicola TaxID=293382 RepID=A0AAI9X6M9_PENTH|nr:hypothetical protein VN97_g8206 [Penicillium thymicola]